MSTSTAKGEKASEPQALAVGPTYATGVGASEPGAWERGGLHVGQSLRD